MFLQGSTPHGIAKALTEEGIPTPAGKTNWGAGTVKSILSNEKYKGDALLQKTFCEADVRARFVRAANQLLSGREEAIAAYEAAQAVALDTTPLETEKSELLAELEVVAGLIQQLVRQNATTTMDQTEFQNQYDRLHIPCL